MAMPFPKRRKYSFQIPNFANRKDSREPNGQIWTMRDGAGQASPATGIFKTG